MWLKKKKGEGANTKGRLEHIKRRISSIAKRVFIGGDYYFPAIDIGTSSAKLVQIDRKGNELKLITHGEVVYEDQVFAGTEVMDRYALVDYIRRLVDDFGAMGKKIVTHIPAHACFYTVLTIPRTKAPGEAVLSFIRETFPQGELTQIKLDYQIIPTTAEGNTIDIAVATVKRDFLEEYTSIITEAGLVPAIVDIEPAAISNQFYFNHPEAINEAVCMVDIGASFTKVVVSHGGYPYTVRVVELGGNTITEQIQREFVLTKEDAERLKRGEDLESVDYSTAFEKVISPSIKRIATEISWTIKSFEDRYRKNVDTIYLYGGSSRLQRLPDELKDITDKEVLFGFPLNFFGVTGYEDFDVAVGLSLRFKGDSGAKV